MKSRASSGATYVGEIARAIMVLRGHRVLLDSELAALYGVTTKRLNEQVKRNLLRFPEDFLFRLTRAEVDALNRSQIATGSQKHRDPRFPPFAFTEHGAIQAANVLNSPRAIEMGIYVVRAFVQLREFLASNRELARRLGDCSHAIGDPSADGYPGADPTRDRIYGGSGRSEVGSQRARPRDRPGLLNISGKLGADAS